MSDSSPDLSRAPTWTLPQEQRHAATPELWLCQALSRSVAFDAAAVVVGTALDVRYQLAGSDPQLRRFGDLQQTVADGEQPIGTLGLFPLHLTDEPRHVLGALVIARRRVEPFVARDLEVLRAAARLIATVVESQFTEAHRLSGLLTDDVSAAVGVVMERMGDSAADALARLRVAAFADGVTVQELARRLVTGEHVEFTD